MSKHPLARRASRRSFRPSGRQQTYGDGMFFFTRPVGAPINYPEGQGENRNMSPRGEYAVTTGYTSGGEFLGDYYADGANTRGGGYGDGAFYFLQKVGQPVGGYGDISMNVPSDEPQVVRMGFAGAVDEQYGAATPTVPGIRGPSPRVTQTTGGRPSGRGGQRAQTATVASPETVAAFEKAADDYGRAKFWFYVWSNNQSRKVGEVSRAEFRKRSDAWNAARTAYDAAERALLAGVPATFDSKGIGTNAIGLAFNKYALSLIDNGYYAEAYRNAKGSERTHAGSVFDAIRDDLKDPLKGKYSGMSLDEAVAIARGYLSRDVQSRMVDPEVDARSADVVNIWGKDALKYVDKSDLDAMNLRKRPIDQLTKAVFTSAFRTQYQTERAKQDRARAGLTSGLLTNKQTFENLRQKVVTDAAAMVVVTRAKDAVLVAAQGAKNAEDAAKVKSTEAETRALGMDVAGTEAAAAAAMPFAAQADAFAKQAESALATATSALRTLGTSAASEKRAVETAVGQARMSATNAARYAQSAVARVESAKAAKKAADDKAALDAVTRTVESAQQAVDAAQRNLDAVKARLALGQATQMDVDAAQRALDEATGRLVAAQAEAARLAEAAKQSAQAASDLDKRADDLGTKVPEGAVQPRGRGPLRKVETDKSTQAGGEGFFSKYSTEVILGGAVLAIGGYFAWQKYGKK